MSSNDPMNFGEEEQAVTATADLESESIEVSRLPSSSSSILTTDICSDKEELEDAIFPFDKPDSNIISSINKSSISSESTSERRSPNDDADADADADAATETTTGQRPQHEKNVLPDRPSQDVARDTKRILEICYGNAKGILEELSTALIGDDEVVTESEVKGEKEDSAKRQKKKKTSKKRRKKNDKELSTALIGDDAVVTENEEKEDSAKREKKKKTSKKRRKKDDKIKKEMSTVQMKSIRDATGKIVRKRRKIKDRHRVVRKDLIKRGKDVKTELSTISEDLNDDDDDNDDNDDNDENGNHSSNDSEIFVSISIDEEEDIYHDDKDVSNTSKEDDDGDDGGGDDDEDDLKSEVDEQETDADCHDTEESKMGSCTEDEEDINAERKMNCGECIEEDTVSLEIERCPDPVRNDDDSVIPNDVDSVPQTTPINIATAPTIQLPDIENHLTSPPSVDSTECTSTGGDDLEEKSSTFCGSYRMICCGALFVVIVTSLTVLAFYLISLYDIFPGPSFTPTNPPQADQYPSLRPSLTPTLSPSISTYLSPTDGPSLLVTTVSPSKMLEPSSIPIVTPTSAPTTILNTSSTSCQLPIQTVDVHTVEAEDASKKMGNAIISDRNEGYCGEGYLTDLVGIGSGFEFAPLKVYTTGYYRVALRYNYNEKSAISLHLKIDETKEGQFDLISTGNKTTWMVDGIDNILLSQGEHVIQLSVPTETDDGPHIDWLTVSMLKPVSRFDYLVSILAQLTDVTTPSQSQISALVWMASEDPMDWSSLTDQEIIERYALVQIYYSASGDIWFNTNEWLSEFHACTWYGIACSKDALVTDLMLGKANYGSFFDEAKIDILQPDS
jgi:hypothetical protein